MKGFVRIMEAIVASVIILASLTYFFKLDIMGSAWGDVNLQTQSKDVVASLYKNGLLTTMIRDNDIENLNNQLIKNFQRTIDFSVTIKGIPNAKIYVGCNCTQADINRLVGILSPLTFNYKNRVLEILIREELIENITEVTNVIFIFGYKNLTPVQSQINNFLIRGGTIFVLGDLTQDQANDGIFNTIFGLNWSGTGTPSVDANFYDTSNPENVSFYISKYFANISGLPKNTTFNRFNSNRISSGKNTIIVDSSGGFSYARVNKNIIYGNGRAVWMSDYSSGDTKTNNLTKALVMWSSGEEYKMDTYKKTVPITYTESGFIIYDQDPYQFIITVWKIF
jgi:hypothetical protein